MAKTVSETAWSARDLRSTALVTCDSVRAPSTIANTSPLPFLYCSIRSDREHGPVVRELDLGGVQRDLVSDDLVVQHAEPPHRLVVLLGDPLRTGIQAPNFQAHMRKPLLLLFEQSVG